MIMKSINRNISGEMYRKNGYKTIAMHTMPSLVFIILMAYSQMMLADGMYSEPALEEARGSYGQYVPNSIKVNLSTTRFFYEATFNYHSKDENNNDIILSAFMTWPQLTTPNHAVLYCPYTHTANHECASESGFGSEDFFTIGDNWYIAPDGEGFGHSVNRTQIYLNHEVWALQEVDCLKAAWEARKEIANIIPFNLEEDWSLVLAGTSQGGGTALATMRYLENVPSDKVPGMNLYKLYRLDFANVCCGPYDPYLTMMTYFAEGSVSYPCVIPMVIQSMINSYSNSIMKGVKEEDFYCDYYNHGIDENGNYLKEEFNGVIIPVSPRRMINGALWVDDDGKKIAPDELGKYNETELDDVNALFVKYLGKDNNGKVPINKILNEGVLNLAKDPANASDAAKKLMECLQKNSVFDGEWSVHKGPWKPVRKIKFNYNPDDNVVPYKNSERLRDLYGKYEIKGNDISRSPVYTSCLVLNKLPIKKLHTNPHVAACASWMATEWTSWDDEEESQKSLQLLYFPQRVTSVNNFQIDVKVTNHKWIDYEKCYDIITTVFYQNGKEVGRFAPKDFEVEPLIGFRKSMKNWVQVALDGNLKKADTGYVTTLFFDNDGDPYCDDEGQPVILNIDYFNVDLTGKADQKIEIDLSETNDVTIPLMLTNNTTERYQGPLTAVITQKGQIVQLTQTIAIDGLEEKQIDFSINASGFDLENESVTFYYGSNPLFVSTDDFTPLKVLLTFSESGKFGDNLTWNFDRDAGLLSIGGSGPMTIIPADGTQTVQKTDIPWYPFRKLIMFIVIGKDVTSIADYAFADCECVSYISCDGSSAPAIGSNTFEGINFSGRLVTLPSTDYRNWLNMLPDGWGASSTLPSDANLIWRYEKSGRLSFECNDKDKISTIPDYSSPTQVPWVAYKNGITHIDVDHRITTIGKNAFAGNSNLVSISFPHQFTLSENALAGCGNLSEISLNNCTSIAANAFNDCSALTSITITAPVCSAGNNAFSGSFPSNGCLHVTEENKDYYQDWPGNVLPIGWHLDKTAKYMVSLQCGMHGTASLDKYEVTKGEEVTLSVTPDLGYLVKSIKVKIGDSNEEMKGRMFGNKLKIIDNTIIEIAFVEDDKVSLDSDDDSDVISGDIIGGGSGNNSGGGSGNSGGNTGDDSGNNSESGYNSPVEKKHADYHLLRYFVNDFLSCFSLSADKDPNNKVGNLNSKLANLLTLTDPCENIKISSLSPTRRLSLNDVSSSVAFVRSAQSSDVSLIADFQEKLSVVVLEMTAIRDILVEFFGDENWVNLTTEEELRTLLEVLDTKEDEVLTKELLLPCKPQNITLEELDAFARRINQTRSRAAGIPIGSNNFIHVSVLDSCCADIARAEAASEAYGYEDTDEMWEQEFATISKEVDEKSQTVCATITLQFTQKLVMTRQAFRGTLTVYNGHEDTPMRDVRLNLVVSDKQGHVATSHEFQINGQSLKGFAGEVDLGSGWTLDAQATGEATILFIPTKYAAPTEPVEYSFGGTLTYIDPFTDLEVTRDLYPVTLTVKPSPNLDLTYFMQRDILGDNALTTDVVEPMVPAEFALLIHNDGYGDATDVRMTTEQPKIVENEKGLLIDFELLSSQVNGKDKVMALGGSVPADFGTIPAHSTAYAQWMLQASLLGHFTDYNVEATHVTSYGNEDLSLLNEVTIHELIHSLSLTDVDGEPLVGWLVNDVTDANDEPDMLYFSNAETTSVNMLSEEQMNMGAVDNDNVSVTLSVGVAQAGWYYGCLVDPMAGRARITAVTRQSDGASIDPQNFWLTEYTLVDGKDPIQEYMLHFADTLSTTSETYTIAFEMLPEEMLSVTAFTLPDKGDSSIYPDYVTTVGITFSKAIDPATFTIDDLKLTCRGKTIDLSGVTLSTEDNITFTMNLTGLTTEDGYYVLTVQTADITDATGYNGQAGKSVDWTQFYGGLLVLRAESQPAEGGSVSYEETAQKAALRRANENGDAQNESVLEVKVPYNSDGALTAQSAEGFGFGGWYMNDQLLSTESRYTSIFIDHTNLTAQFKQLYFDLTVDWNANRGTVTGAGTGKYSYGSNLSLVATPFEGYRFYQWEVNDEVPDDNPGSAYTHTVTGNATLSPLFLAETSSGLLLGDVKEDGNINVGDYTALVSLIVGTDGGRYLLETADHNGNKKADVGDLATEVNMIMDIGSFAANSLRHMGDNGVVQSEFDPDNRLYGPEMTLKAGDEISVPLFLANKDEVSAFQTDIVLPDGLTLLDVAVAEERTTKLDHNLLVTSSKNGGTIRLLAGSSSNVSYRGAAGAVVMLRLRADEDMEDGEYIYQLKHTVLSSADSQIFHAPDCSMPMRIGNATGILTVSPQAESAKGIYDVAGRKIANEATIDVVNRLPAGVYVVSGRKIVVR